MKTWLLIFGLGGLMGKQEIKMMSIEEIQNSENINEDVVKEALNNVKEYLKDALDTKNQIEQRSFVLFNGVIPLLIAEFSAAYYVKYSAPPHLDVFEALTVMIFFSTLSLICLIWSMMGFKYGASGSTPDKWLQKETLCADPKYFKTILAYRVFRTAPDIQLSVQSNAFKITLIRAAIVFLIGGILIAAVKIFL